MKSDTAITALTALANETRLAAFRRLVAAGCTGMAAGVLAEELGVPPATLSFHLKELSRAGLLRADRRGRSIVYAADYAAMDGLIAFLSENCCKHPAPKEAQPHETHAPVPVGE